MEPIRLHAFERCSAANGPGRRCVAWFQGCTLGCKGCFNPETHTGPPRRVVTVEALLEEIVSHDSHDGLEGLTVTGGEPFQQPEALLALLRAVRRATELSVLVFSGYTLPEIERQPNGSPALEQIDVLIAGRYLPGSRLARGLLGSENQTVHLLTTRYRADEVASTPDAEVIIDPTGRVTLSGVNPLRVARPQS